MSTEELSIAGVGTATIAEELSTPAAAADSVGAVEAAELSTPAGLDSAAGDAAADEVSTPARLDSAAEGVTEAALLDSTAIGVEEAEVVALFSIAAALEVDATLVLAEDAALAVPEVP